MSVLGLGILVQLCREHLQLKLPWLQMATARIREVLHPVPAYPTFLS